IVARKLDRKQLAPLGNPVPLTAFRKGEATQPFARVFGDTLYIAYRYLVTGSTSEIRLMRIPLGEKSGDGGILSKGVEPHASEDRAAGKTVVLRTQPRQAEPSMVCDSDGCLVVWDDEAAGAYAGFVPQDQEQPLWHRQFSAKGKRPTVARSASGQAAVAFYAGDRLFISPVDRDGIGKPSVISRVSGFQPQPSLVEGTEPGEWLVAWRDYEAGQLEIFVARAHCTATGEQE